MAKLNSKQQQMLEKLRKVAEQRKQERAEQQVALQHKMAHVPLQHQAQVPAPEVVGGKSKLVWNEQQQQAINMALAGQEFCLIGAAGTGKTTTVKQIIEIMLQRISAEFGGKVPPNAIALVSYTNRAVKNLIKAVRDIEGTQYCSTIHKFLGFHPEYFDVVRDDGTVATTMRFVPEYHEHNPITECKLVVVDEASMVDVALFEQLKAAVPNAKFIFIGDLNQLKPVFGDPILGHKLAELPVVELVQVYRQAMESPIVRFQHQYTLKGVLPGDTTLQEFNAENSGLYFQPLAKELRDQGELMAQALATFIQQRHEKGLYDPTEDIVLIPFNKSFGTIHINAHLAQYFSQLAGEPVHEIVAGIGTKYFAVGDYVLHNKNEYRIIEIQPNKLYLGNKVPQNPDVQLDRFGINHNKNNTVNLAAMLDRQEEIDHKLLLQMTSAIKENLDNEAFDEVKQAASHVLVLQSVEFPEQIVRVSTAGEINALDFGYCITIHKSQGSEWRRVYLIATNSHATMLSRELLYTGMTRAKEELHVIYSPQTAPGRKNSSIAKAIKRQDIPGKTWQEKAAFFRRKAEANGKKVS